MLTRSRTSPSYSKILPVLIDELWNLDNSIQAAQLLGEMVAAARPAIPALQKATQSEAPETSQVAAALTGIRPDTVPSVEPDGDSALEKSEDTFLVQRTLQIVKGEFCEKTWL